MGFDADAVPAGWWRPEVARAHVLRWVVEMGLGWDRVVEVARATRDGHGEPPDGPKALDRAMARATRGVRSGKSDRNKPPASEEDQLQFYADWINGDRHLPTSAISVRTVRELIDRGLVTVKRARERGL
ncbi:hypothetical protein FGG78_33895 [Thioclava sp. BHET1]|nr:hypothetical protein FGG78_33895 [Thioclava sp. BHET1]